jgi:hypothetical protein
MKSLMRSLTESGSASDADSLATRPGQPFQPPPRSHIAVSSSGLPMASGSHIREGSRKRSRIAIFNGSFPPAHAVTTLSLSLRRRRKIMQAVIEDLILAAEGSETPSAPPGYKHRQPRELD